MAYTVKIGGVLTDLEAGSLNVVNQIGQRSTGSLHVKTALGVAWQYGTQVQVYNDSGALVYAGYTTKDLKRKRGGARQGTGWLDHEVKLMDNCYRADKRRVFKTYLAATAGFIFTDLCNTYLVPEGVTYTANSIASGPIITEVIWNGTKSVSEAFTWLATQAGYWWDIDLNAVAWFQPYGGVAAPWAVDGTQVDALQDLSVEHGNDMYINKQYAKGAFAERKGLQDTFHGDGVKKAFTCQYPLSSHVVVTLNGASQPLGKKGIDNGQPFIWAQGDAVVAQDPNGATLTSGDTLVVSYNGRYPVIASAQNPALILAQQAREGGGTGLVESTFTNTKVHTLPAAFQIAGSLLAHYGADTTVLTFSTRQTGLAPGQMLTVNLPDFNLNNKNMLINSVGIDDQGPDGYSVWFRVSAVGSPVETAQWQTYWQNLMNQSSDPADLQDIADMALALLLASTVSTTWHGTVTKQQATCPIFNTSTLFDNTLIFC